MNRTASLLVITLASCLSAQAQTAKSKSAALPDVAVMAGQDSDSLLRNPLIKARMKRLLGARYDSFMESFETINPVTKERNFLFSSGCLIHACTHLESAIAVDLVNQTIHAAIFRQDEKTKYFNEGGKATPAVIKDWADELQRINAQTSSESKPALAAPEVTETQPETAAPKRLRNAANVRGLVGGEAHDSYVIHARKGQTLTLRLSWRREEGNWASLSVSESPDGSASESTKLGAEYDHGRRWVGKIPKSGDYYVEVVAHPAAHYRLKVSIT